MRGSFWEATLISGPCADKRAYHKKAEVDNPTIIYGHYNLCDLLSFLNNTETNKPNSRLEKVHGNDLIFWQLFKKLTHLNCRIPVNHFTVMVLKCYSDAKY